MDIEKLIERLQNWDGIKPDREIDCAIEGLKALQAENDRLKRERDEMVIDMTALMAGHCCDLCAVEYCIVRGKTEMCTAFKWRGPKEE